MIERFALFTMIVLGESFVKVIDSLAGEPANAGTFVFGILGMTVACSIWWLYFDHGPESEIKTGKVFTWIYSHLPLLIGITALAVAINKLVLLNLGEPLKMEYRWLFCGTVAICLGAVALINAVSFHPEQHTDYTGLSRMQAISAVGALLIGLIGGMLPALVVVVLVALLCIAQVIISRRIKGRPTLDAAIAG
jgi:low temperature requirement protein LtrA